MKFSSAAAEKLLKRTTDWNYRSCFSILRAPFAVMRV